MKKILFLTIVLITLTGCEATYNVHIEKDEIKENVTVTGENDKDYSKIKSWSGLPLTLYYDQDLENPFGDSKEKEDGVSYYEENFNDEERTLTSSASFDFSNHIRSSLVRGCFKYYNIAEDENDSNIVTFATSEGLICDFSNFKVVLDTPYKVINNNADSVNSLENIYTWDISGSNSSKTKISLTIDFSQKFDETGTSNNEESNDNTNNSSNDQDESNKSTTAYMFIVIVLGVVLIIVLTLILKYKKNKLSDV